MAPSTTSQPSPIWKALADPKRRQIITLLEEKPRTTGELCAHFDVTRFAIMKHLNVLEEAGLLLVEREGRQRWNILNPERVEELQQSHVDPSPTTTAVLREQGLLQKVSQTAAPSFTLADITLEVELPASQEFVYRALTVRLDSWWSLRQAAGSRLSLECRPGGRLLETLEERDEGWLLATVTYAAPGRGLHFAGSLAIEDPFVLNQVRFSLKKQGAGTTLHLAHQLAGAIDEPLLSLWRDNWQRLLQTDLLHFCQKQPEEAAGHAA